MCVCVCVRVSVCVFVFEFSPKFSGKSPGQPGGGGHTFTRAGRRGKLGNKCGNKTISKLKPSSN